MRRRPWPLVIACVVAAPVAAGVVLALGHDVHRAEAARPLFARDQDYAAAAAHAHLPPPPPDDTFVTPGYHLEINRIRPLLGLQASDVISVGEWPRLR